MDWPAQCPDLNTEHAWYQLDTKLSESGVTPTYEADMTEKLEDAWYKIPSFVIKDLIDSMPRRRQAIINSNGAPPNIRFFDFVLPIFHYFQIYILFIQRLNNLSIITFESRGRRM